MRKDTLTFADRQPQVTVCNGGRQALVLLNERAKEVVPVMPEREWSEEPETRTEYEYDAWWLQISGQRDADILAAAKNGVLEEIATYDKSEAVNAFSINGKTAWLDKATRVGLMNSVAIAKTMGHGSTVLWIGGLAMEMTCNKAIELLSALEMYAQECYNTTAMHQEAVRELSDVTDVLNYDYRSGYPERLYFDV